MNEALRCQTCGEVIGFYEPMIVLTDNGAHETSRAAHPSLQSSDGEHYHGSCYLLQHGEDQASD
jgi:hypothetical protein